MNHSYVLTRAADADLADVLLYTLNEWGRDQALRYANDLERGLEALAAGKPPIRRLDKVHTGLRMLRCKRHFLFGLQRPDLPMLIVAILHERMDVIARVAPRLE